MKNNIIKVILIFSIGLNIILGVLYNKVRSESKEVDYLYSMFDSSIVLMDTYTINARNGFEKESLVDLYSTLSRASSSSWYLMNKLKLPNEDITVFYHNLLKEWIIDNYIPSLNELDLLEKDLIYIEETFRMSLRGGTPKDNNLLDWNEEEYMREVSNLKNKLYFYNNQQ